MPDKLLDYAEVGRRLTLSRSQLFYMVRRGELPEPVRIGRARRFRESDIDAFVASLTADGPDGSAGAAAA